MLIYIYIYIRIEFDCNFKQINKNKNRFDYSIVYIYIQYIYIHILYVYVCMYLFRQSVYTHKMYIWVLVKNSFRLTFVPMLSSRSSPFASFDVTLKLSKMHLLQFVSQIHDVSPVRSWPNSLRSVQIINSWISNETLRCYVKPLSFCFFAFALNIVIFSIWFILWTHVTYTSSVFRSVNWNCGIYA